MIDPIALTADLIRCPSVTPEEGGALVLLADILSAHGFETTRVDREGTANLFARKGPKGARTLGFNGHTDVVPVGEAAAWTHPPFSATTASGQLWGRGAQDMKSGVAAWVAAACAAEVDGALILTITGDEEGPATHGTRALLDWMADAGERMDACIVGEPTCPNTMGEMIKIGRRGSLTAHFTAQGTQGHVAYPHRADNPVPRLVRLLDRLASAKLDEGTAHFDPSGLQITTVDVGNPATNVIPATARASVNIRFNDQHSADTLSTWLRREARDADTDVDITCSGDAFVTPPGPLSDLVVAAVMAETGQSPVLSTSGGTSDARFVKDHCPVVEVGLVGDAMHQVDESVPTEQITQLTAIYRRIIDGFFA